MALPQRTTLSRRVSHFRCEPGLQMEFFKLLKLDLSVRDERTCESVLMFDEMHTSQSIEYCPTFKRLLPAYKKVQVALIRGLIHPWKQIIYYDFDTTMNKSLLDSIINLCELSNAKVRGIVCDMGNHTLLKELGVYKEKKMFL